MRLSLFVSTSAQLDLTISQKWNGNSCRTKQISRDTEMQNLPSSKTVSSFNMRTMGRLGFKRQSVPLVKRQSNNNNNRSTALIREKAVTFWKKLNLRKLWMLTKIRVKRLCKYIRNLLRFRISKRTKTNVPLSNKLQYHKWWKGKSPNPR